MILFSKGDILADTSDAIVNPVNCVGVMGRGLALQFKTKFPENFKAYQCACKRNELKPGRLHVFKNTTSNRTPTYIINFPTKRHWRDQSILDDIQAGLDAIIDIIRENNIRSVAIPALGCGLGGLEWATVKQSIQYSLDTLHDVRICHLRTRLIGQNPATNGKASCLPNR
jgi:O-acetyl-ADP-ribose deacetylase (regulator of RNase III)